MGLVVASVADEGWATEPFLSFRATTVESQACCVQQIVRTGGGGSANAAARVSVSEGQQSVGYLSSSEKSPLTAGNNSRVRRSSDESRPMFHGVPNTLTPSCLSIQLEHLGTSEIENGAEL